MALPPRSTANSVPSAKARRWTADLAEGWDIFGITNGGYLMSIATRAMAAESGDRTLIAATGAYLNPATAGPVDVTVEVLKRGRTLSTLRGVLSQDGKNLVCVSGVLTGAVRQAEDANLVLGAPPKLPPVEECVSVEPSQTGPLPPPFSGKVDLRLHPDDAGMIFGNRATHSLMRGWFRLKEDEQLDANAVVLAADAFPPAIFNSDLTLGWTPTVELTVQIRNPAPSGWLACRYATRFVTDGMLEEDGEIWDESGNPVALSRQLALVPQ
ncbi:MAG: thioesterase family protein [Acidimicrobiia bacterium]